MRRSGFRSAAAGAVFLAGSGAAFAGPPFLTDDPDPTPYREYEIYAFASGVFARGGQEGAAGIDFNYGGGPDLQLTATFPFGVEHEDGGDHLSGLGDIELAAKYRFLRQESFGWDVAVFPRLFVPSNSEVGSDHVSFLLPIWVGHEWDDWSTFGGGGCAINRGGDAKDYCIAGWTVTHRFLPNLQVGGELFHQSADTEGGFASTIAGIGATYDATDMLHVLGYVGAGLENADETGREVGYVSVLFTF